MQKYPPTSHNAKSIEIIPNKLYWVSDVRPPRSQKMAYFFCIDNELEYRPFFNDFGPLNLAMTHRFCVELDNILNDEEYKDCKIYHYCSDNYKKRANGAYLMCAFQVIMLNRSPSHSWSYFKNLDPPFVPFRDAMKGVCSYQCTILDCLYGLDYGLKFRFYNPVTFDPNEYEFYEELEHGDFNWIIPNKLLAFSSPNDHHCISIPTEEYVTLFKKLGVKLVIRLNTKEYDKTKFTKRGIKHVDLFFEDGSCPSSDIVNKFIELCENETGAIAVHCKAGLGRTGTLICCYAMKKYKIPAAAMIAWTRICRPGSVLGPQQQFVIEKEKDYLSISSHTKTVPNSPSLVTKFDKLSISEKYSSLNHNLSNLSLSSNSSLSKEDEFISKYGDIGQADRLLSAKNRYKADLLNMKVTPPRYQYNTYYQASKISQKI